MLHGLLGVTVNSRTDTQLTSGTTNNICPPRPSTKVSVLWPFPLFPLPVSRTAAGVAKSLSSLRGGRPGVGVAHPRFSRSLLAGTPSPFVDAGRGLPPPAGLSPNCASFFLPHSPCRCLHSVAPPFSTLAPCLDKLPLTHLRPSSPPLLLTNPLPAMYILAAAPPPGSIPGMDVTTFSGAALVAFLVVAVLSFTLLRGLSSLPLGAGEGAGLGVGLQGGRLGAEYERKKDA